MELEKKKKRYNKEFKDSAVKLVHAGKKSAAQVARELGLPEWQVQNWVRDSKKRETTATSGDGNLLEENKRLRKELAQAKEEAEILKKAAAYFARHQQ